MSRQDAWIGLSTNVLTGFPHLPHFFVDSSFSSRAQNLFSQDLGYKSCSRLFFGRLSPAM